MKKVKLLKTLLIPTLGVTALGTVVAFATSCNSAVKVTGVTLNKSETTIGLRGTETLVATVSPTDATDKTVTWSTDDETIASVNQKGVVTGMAPGKTNITVKTNDGGFEAKCQVTVTDSVIHVTGVTLDQTTLSIPKAKQRTLTATISPENATDKSVTWTSSDEAVATVDQNGNVTANATGEADITVTTTDGGYEAKCHVTVTENVIHVTGVTLNKSETTIGLRGTETLVATVSPTDATDKTVTWSTDDETIASVNQKGVVTGMAPGKTNITVKTNDGGFEAKCQVTVTDSVIHVTGVTLDQTTLSIPKAKQRTLTATISPENATDKSVTWTSSDEAVATVDQNGNVTANATGEADITVTTTDGGYEAKCHVTVTDSVIHVTSVSLNKKSTTLDVGNTETLTATVLPDNATDKRVTWSSSDTEVATVNDKGEITALAEGTATIVVTSVDNNECTDTCEVSVASAKSENLIITASVESTLELENEGGNNPNLEFSNDGSEWTKYTGQKVTIPANNSLYLKGDNPDGWSSSTDVSSNFKIKGSVSLSGSVMALLDNGAGPGEEGHITNIPNDYCFYDLFDASDITSVSKNLLSATELKKYCYYNIFYQCELLTNSPVLPATELVDYCYDGMFEGCTSLIDAPELPVETLASGCYSQMFKGCTSLTKAPALPATTLKSYCYTLMFSQCNSLIDAPELPAKNLAIGCYWAMFMNCTALTSVKIGYTDLYNETYFGKRASSMNWVSGVAESGAFYYTGSDTAQNFGFPEGWQKK